MVGRSPVNGRILMAGIRSYVSTACGRKFKDMRVQAAQRATGRFSGQFHLTGLFNQILYSHHDVN
jgi:hypothetical protein